MVVDGSEVSVVVGKTIGEVSDRIDNVDVGSKFFEDPAGDIGKHPVTSDVYGCLVIEDKETGRDEVIVGLVGLAFLFVDFVKVWGIVRGEMDKGDVLVVGVMFVKGFVLAELFVTVDDSRCAIDMSSLGVKHVVYPVHVALGWGEGYDDIATGGY